MNEAKPFDDTTIKILWHAMQASTLMLIPIIYVLNHFIQLEPIMPDLKNIFIGICIISAAAPFTIHSFFKREQLIIRENIQTGIENTPEKLKRYFIFLLIGMSLCNLPGMFGFVLYIIAGDLKFALIFIGVSFFLGYLYKPELN